MQLWSEQKQLRRQQKTGEQQQLLQTTQQQHDGRHPSKHKKIV